MAGPRFSGGGPERFFQSEYISVPTFCQAFGKAAGRLLRLPPSSQSSQA